MLHSYLHHHCSAYRGIHLALTPHADWLVALDGFESLRDSHCLDVHSLPGSTISIKASKSWGLSKKATMSAKADERPLITLEAPCNCKNIGLHQQSKKSTSCQLTVLCKLSRKDPGTTYGVC